MKAIIMAGGLGARLRPLTEIIPKPLLPLGERTVLEIILAKLKKHGFKEVTITLNYKSELIEAHLSKSDCGLKINYFREKSPLGTAGSLQHLKDELTEPFLVINGDILTNLDFGRLMKEHKSSNAMLTAVTKIIETPLQYGVIESKGDDVTNLLEKPNLQSEVLAGIYALSPAALDFIPDAPLSMVELIKSLLEANKSVSRHLLTVYWLDIGHLQNYEKAKLDVIEGVV